MKQNTFLLTAGLLGAALGLGQTAQAQSIKIDGSSTVYPISAAVAEQFNKSNPKIRITVGISGTGGGFKKFGAKEIDISDASRPIKASEATQAKANGVSYIELPVAYDAITVVVSKQNTWAKSMTRAELKKIWEPGSKVKKWSDIRAGWPSRPIKLYGPGTDSGTFDYFTEAINGKEKASRADYTASEDDNVLVQGVSRDIGALGYFGLAYYEENKDKLRAVAIDNGSGPVLPSIDTVVAGKYQPLARPLFIYVNRTSANQKHVAAFVRFYIANSANLSKRVGYIPLPSSIVRLANTRFAAKKTGSIFGNQGAVVGVRLSDLLRRESR